MSSMRWRHLVLAALVVAVLVASVAAVDRKRFKTCDQSGFCKRNRAFAQTGEGDSAYELITGSQVRTSGRYIADVLNRATGVKFRLILGNYGAETPLVRVTVREKAPLHARYEVVDVLGDDVERRELPDRDGLIFGAVQVQESPFALRFIDPSTGEVVVTANGRGLFNIEHFREESDEVALAQPGYRMVPAEDQWKEKFGSHSDEKPFGPASISMDFRFNGASHVYGIPEHASDLALKSTTLTDPYRLYNLDVFEYELDETMALYGAVPLMISQRQGKSTAVFWLNASETWVDVDNAPANAVDTHWFSESGAMDFFVLFGPTAKDVVVQYAGLTGTTPLPPLFSIAYHQCRWNYKDQADVSMVNSKFNEFDMPMDVIWLDIEHTNSKKYFTWDAVKFPDSVAMLDEVSSSARKMVTIVDPHIKKERGYHVYDAGNSNDFWVKEMDGRDYEGFCWPGASMYLDFSNPAVRAYWAEQFKVHNYVGSSEDLFIWNDMNEPSVFNGPEVTMYKHLVHQGGVEHRDLHNAFGMWVHRATYEGLMERSMPKKRPFVLSRAFFAGSQKYGAIWTGDNAAEWGHLEASVPMLLSLSMSGITFCGADVGGFFGDPEPELLARWYQAGAYQPFFRGHGHLDTKRREPYLFGEPWTSIMREALRSRYSLLPYWYTLFFRNSQSGMPPMRPLWLEYPEDSNTYAMQDQFLVGSDILVKPIAAKGLLSTEVYFPGSDSWYDVKTYQKYGSGTATVDAPLEKIPVYQRAGSIVPRKERARRSSSCMVQDPYTLVVALDDQQTASGELYVDDGATFAFEHGEYLLKSFSFADGVLSSSSLSDTTYPANVVVEKIVILGLEGSSATATNVADGTGIEVINTVVATILKKPNVSIVDDWSIRLA